MDVLLMVPIYVNIDVDFPWLGGNPPMGISLGRKLISPGEKSEIQQNVWICSWEKSAFACMFGGSPGEKSTNGAFPFGINGFLRRRSEIQRNVWFSPRGTSTFACMFGFRPGRNPPIGDFPGE
jgi:hypothetical protein